MTAQVRAGSKAIKKRPMLQEDAAGSHLGRAADLPAVDEEFIPGGKANTRCRAIQPLPLFRRFASRPGCRKRLGPYDAVADDAVCFEDVRREEGHIVAGDHGIGQFPFVENGLAAGRSAGRLQCRAAGRPRYRSPGGRPENGRWKPPASAIRKSEASGVPLCGFVPEKPPHRWPCSPRHHPSGRGAVSIHPPGFSRPPFPRLRSPDIPLCPGGPPVLPDHPCPR